MTAATRPARIASLRDLDGLFAAYLALAAVGLMIAGHKSFSLWSQVTVLEGQNPLRLMIDGHPHALRYAVVWPVFEIARLLSVEASTVFSALGVACVIVLMRLTASSAASMRPQPGFVRTRSAAYWMAIYLVFLDGRLVLALVGFALILQAHLELAANPTARQPITRPLVGLGLTGVGTGPLIVGAAAFVWFSIDNARGERGPRHRRWVPAAALLVGAVLTGPLIRKNLEFFRGNLGRLLEHGLGPELLPIVILGVPGVMLLWPWLTRSLPPRLHVVRLVAVSAMAGVFGLSGLAMATVPLAALLISGLPIHREPAAARRPGAGRVSPVT